jgi:hypothetical protein
MISGVSITGLDTREGRIAIRPRDGSPVEVWRVARTGIATEHLTLNPQQALFSSASRR